MGDTTAQIHVDVIDIVDDGRDIDNNNKMHGATNSPSTRANDCIDEFFYMFCDIMTGRDDTYLQIYDGQRRRLEYNKFAPRELYAISMVSRTAYSLCRAKLDKWRRLYNKYRRYFAESFHNHITQSMRLLVRRSMQH